MSRKTPDAMLTKSNATTIVRRRVPTNVSSVTFFKVMKRSIDALHRN